MLIQKIRYGKAPGEMKRSKNLALLGYHRGQRIARSLKNLFNPGHDV
jgi:hypothetical protein